MLPYLLIKFIVLLFAILPWRAIYPISRFFAFILRSIIRYRHTMLYDNLAISFPKLTKKELTTLHRSVYRQYTEITCENLKSFSVKPEELQSRITVENIDLLKNQLKQNQNCLAYTSHFANWEWQAMIGALVNYQLLGVYKASHNEKVEALLQGYRNRWGIEFSTVKNFPKKAIKQLKKDLNPTSAKIIFLLSDQNPTKQQPSTQVDFLNRKTNFVVAPERLATRYNLPAFFIRMSRKCRGHYHIKIEQYNEQEKREESLTHWYAKQLEKQIIEDPASWLWLHNRWKKRD